MENHFGYFCCIQFSNFLSLTLEFVCFKKKKKKAAWNYLLGGPLRVHFPYHANHRLCTNQSQDSLLKPMLTKDLVCPIQHSTQFRNNSLHSSETAKQ